MSPNPFSEKYSKLSNVELLEILHSPSDYQLSAVEAAKDELNNRNLTLEQTATAQTQLEKKLKLIPVYKKYINFITSPAKMLIVSLIGTIFPSKKHVETPEYIIKIICIVLGGLFLYDIIKDWNLFILELSDLPMIYLWKDTLGYLIPIIILPVSLILFWKKKRMGWIFLSLYITYNLFTILYTFLYDKLREREFRNYTLKWLFPSMPVGVFIWGLLLYGCTIFVICKPFFLKIYSVDNTTTALTIIAAIVITTMQWWHLILSYI